MNACAPKITNTISANQAQRVSASARWVSVSMISPPRMMTPSRTCRSSQP